MLEGHFCWTGVVGLHNRLLFGSDILTLELATARTSTNPQSSSSRLLDEPGLESSLRELLLLINLFLSDSNLGVAVSEVNLKLAFTFGLRVTVSNVGSV